MELLEKMECNRVGEDFISMEFFNSCDLNRQNVGCRKITATCHYQKNRSQIVTLLIFP